MEYVRWEQEVCFFYVSEKSRFEQCHPFNLTGNEMEEDGWLVEEEASEVVFGGSKKYFPERKYLVGHEHKGDEVKPKKLRESGGRINRQGTRSGLCV